MILFVLGSFIVILIIYEIRRVRLVNRYKHIPSLADFPIVGNSYVFTPTAARELVSSFNIAKVVKSKLTKSFIGPTLSFIVSDPEVLQIILTKSNFKVKPYFYDLFRLPNGLITAQYETWKPLRKASNPGFTPKTIESYSAVFERRSTKFCNELKRKYAGTEFNLKDPIVKLVMALNLESNFGVTEDDEMLDTKMVLLFLKNISLRFVNLKHHADFIYKRSEMGHEDRMVDKYLRGFSERLAERRKHFLKVNPNEPKLYIDYLLEHIEANDLNMIDCVTDNLVTLLLAGYETTSFALANAILFLAMHPEFDAKLEKEISENCPRGRPLDFNTLRHLPFLDQVVKETLRLYPTVPLFARQNVEAAHVDKIGHVEKDTMFIIDLYKLHRWADIWGENPNSFNPDRFSPENEKARHPFSYLPFGGGPRTCIGYLFALMNMKYGLVKIFSEFKFRTKLKMEDLDLKCTITLNFTNDFMVEMEPRNWNENKLF